MESSVRIGIAHIAFGIVAGGLIATATSQAEARTEAAQATLECRVRTAEVRRAVQGSSAQGDRTFEHRSSSFRLQPTEWSDLGLTGDDSMRARCEVVTSPDGELDVNCGCGTDPG